MISTTHNQYWRKISSSVGKDEVVVKNKNIRAPGLMEVYHDYMPIYRAT